MRRYIDADALGIGKADRNTFTVPEYADGWNSAIEIIANAPTADVVEVRHGGWIVTDADDGMCEDYAGFIEFKCSECGFSAGFENGQYDWFYGDPIPWKYCPNCGAKMDGERSENG